MCSCHDSCLSCDRSQGHVNFTFIVFLFVGVINKALKQNFKVLYESLYWKLIRTVIITTPSSL